MGGNDKPSISVLTAVRNGELYLDTAIASIVEQSYADFEYILIDDASTDNTPDILHAWATRDRRIRLVHNPRSLNAGGALNRGLAEAQGDYVAILDGDDLSYPTRLAEQVAYLDAHPAIGVVGSQVRSIDSAGKELKVLPFATEPALAQWRLFFQTPVLHSAAMMRRSLIEQVGGYSAAMWTATEYELFARLSQVGGITNLPTTLVAYRHSPNQLSRAHNRVQRAQIFLFLQALVQARFGFDKSKLLAISGLFHAIRGGILDNVEQLAQVGLFLQDLYQAFMTTTALSNKERQWIAEDCACYFLSLAWFHRRCFRSISRELLHSALKLSPNLYTRPQTRTKLQIWREYERMHKDEYTQNHAEGS